jgi:periplasmic protein TonB
MSANRISLLSIIIILWTISCHAQYIEPQPTMGQKALKSFLKYHIDYPEEELINNTQGTVVIGFTTDKDGKVVDYHISKSVSQKLDSSAISIFKLILWNSATSYGINVIGTSDFELKYNVKSFQKISKRRGYKHILIPFNPVDTSGIIYTLKQVDTVPKAILEPETRSLSEMIYNKLTYPDAAFKLGLVGEVKLSFIIETNGLPSNIIPLKHLGGGCTEEATKIIESIRWTPAIFNGKAVRTYYNISVHFKKDDKRDDHIPNQQGSGI